MLSATSESLKVQRGTQTVMALISDKGCAAKRLIQGVDAMPIAYVTRVKDVKYLTNMDEMYLAEFLAYMSLIGSNRCMCCP